MLYFNNIIILLTLRHAFGNSNPIVKTSYGKVEGIWSKSELGRPYASFLGIPYAGPPIGSRRFMDPQPLKSWDGILSAKKYSPVCLQYEFLTNQVKGVEDCLYLNVFTGQPYKRTNLPVIVFIHGGGLINGASSEYDPIRLLDSDVVVVTMNYRLGPLGFLSTEDTVVPGNAGLKDQAVALQWIKKNIVNFGGNPDSITLTGQSAGAACVYYHYLSPWSFGTFNRGAAYSGSAFAPWAFAEKPLENTQFLAKSVGCSTGSIANMIECLKNAPGKALAAAPIEKLAERVRILPIFGPVIEATGVENPFIDQNPFCIAQTAAMQKLPLMMSITSDEGLMPAAAYLADSTLLPDLDARWDQLASEMFVYNDTLPKSFRPLTAERIKDFYFSGKPISKETFNQLVQAFSDRYYKNDVGKQAQLHALRSGQPVYMYRLSYRGNYSFTNILANNTKNYGVSHMDDILHIFKAFGFESKTIGDITMNAVLIQILHSYALTGVPTLPDGQYWPPLSPGSTNIDLIDIRSPFNFELNSVNNLGNKNFWNSLHFSENENFECDE